MGMSSNPSTPSPSAPSSANVIQHSTHDAWDSEGLGTDGDVPVNTHSFSYELSSSAGSCAYLHTGKDEVVHLGHRLQGLVVV
jgi:hypothetical protein